MLTVPRQDVHRDAGDVFARELDLTGMQAGANPEPKLSHAVANRAGAAHRSRRTVEGGDEAVARRLISLPRKRASSLRTSA